MKPWKLYDVEFAHSGLEHWVATGTSRAKVTAQQYRAWREAFGGSFREFLREVRVRRRREPLVDDGYGETRQDWGVQFDLGQQLVIGGRRGVIVYGGKCPGRMVRVAYEGLHHSVMVHALEVKAALQAVRP